MIRLRRPDQEPPALATARAQHLPALRAIVLAQPSGEAQPPEKTSFEGYREAYEGLKDVVGAKCWYCEHKLEVKYDPVEHFRPKQRASRECCKERSGYWWLAWTWRNLMLLCDDCNKAKGIWFPLAEGSVPLAPEEDPPSNEEVLMIDPCAVDPFEHLQFAEERGGTWRVRPKKGSPLGAKTIEKLGLDGVKRPGILEQFRSHVRYTVQPHVDLIRAAMDGGDRRGVVEQWDRSCRALLRGRSPYAALSFHAIDRRIPAHKRDPWRILLPQPPWDPSVTPCVRSAL